MLLPSVVLLLTAATPCEMIIVADAGLEAASSCPAGKLAVGDRLQLAPGGFVRVALPEGAELTCVQADGLPAQAVVAADGPVVETGPVLTCRQSADAPLASGFLVPAAASPPPATVAPELDDDQPPAPPAPASAEPTFPLLVLELEAVSAPGAVTSVLDSVVVAQVEREARLRVSDTASLKALLARAGELAAADAGCTEASDSCVLKVAEALGARYVLGGTVSASDRLLQVQLVLLDSEAQSALARVDYRATNVVQAGDVLPDALHNVLRPLLGGEARSLPEPPPNRTVNATETIQGAAVAGTGAAVGLGLGVVPAICGAGACAASSGVVGLGAGGLMCSIAGPCYAPLLAVAGAAIGAALGDSLLGFKVDAAKALLLGAAAGGLGLSISLATAGALAGGTFVALAFAAAATGSLDTQTLQGPGGLAAGAISGTVLTVALALALVSGVGLGVCFDFATPILEPAPDPLGVSNDESWLGRASEQELPAVRVAWSAQRY